MTNKQIELRDMTTRTETEKAVDARKPYATPELIVHGKLDQLTAGSGDVG